MADPKRNEPLILKLLAELYERERTKIEPRFPYDKAKNTIKLPHYIRQEIRILVEAGKKPEALKLVVELTGAGLRLSKDYIDDLAQKKER